MWQIIFYTPQSSCCRSTTGKKLGFPYKRPFLATKETAPTDGGGATANTSVPVGPPHLRGHPQHLGLLCQSGNWYSCKAITCPKFRFFAFSHTKRELRAGSRRPSKNPRGESGPAVHVHQMSDFPCGGYFCRDHPGRAAGEQPEKSRVSHRNAHFWRPE